jgi:iron complex outermembrane recepter protein
VQSEVFLRARNLLDDEIRNSTSFLRAFMPEAGRSVELGLRLSL